MSDMTLYHYKQEWINYEEYFQTHGMNFEMHVYDERRFFNKDVEIWITPTEHCKQRVEIYTFGGECVLDWDIKMLPDHKTYIRKHNLDFIVEKLASVLI